MLSRISSKRRIGFLEGNDPILFNVPSQAILANGFSDNIDRPLQYFGQPPTERIQTAEIRETFATGFAGHAYDDIDVGIDPLFASRRRAK